MSQIIGLLASDYVYLCSDSKVTNIKCEEKSYCCDKMFFTKHFVIASLGVKIGIDLVSGLINSADKFGIKNIDEVEEYLISIASGQYDLFLEKHNKLLDESFTRVYFIYAGADKNGKLGIKMTGAEKNDKFISLPLKNIITAPRRMGIELNLLKNLNKDDETVSSAIINAMRKLAEVDTGIKAPFMLAKIGIDGNVSITKAV